MAGGGGADVTVSVSVTDTGGIAVVLMTTTVTGGGGANVAALVATGILKISYILVIGINTQMCRFVVDFAG